MGANDDVFKASPMDKGLDMISRSVMESPFALFGAWMMIGPELFDHYVVRGGRKAQERPKKARSVPKE
jgi:hypothetical protein